MRYKIGMAKPHPDPEVDVRPLGQNNPPMQWDHAHTNHFEPTDPYLVSYPFSFEQSRHYSREAIAFQRQLIQVCQPSLKLLMINRSHPGKIPGSTCLVYDS